MMFDWMGVSKNIGGNLIGTSPEFELALYTMAFLSGCAILCAHVCIVPESYDEKHSVVSHPYGRFSTPPLNTLELNLGVTRADVA